MTEGARVTFVRAIGPNSISRQHADGHEFPDEPIAAVDLIGYAGDFARQLLGIDFAWIASGHRSIFAWVAMMEDPGPAR